MNNDNLVNKLLKLNAEEIIKLGDELAISLGYKSFAEFLKTQNVSPLPSDNKGDLKKDEEKFYKITLKDIGTDNTNKASAIKMIRQFYNNQITLMEAKNKIELLKTYPIILAEKINQVDKDILLKSWKEKGIDLTVD